MKDAQSAFNGEEMENRMNFDLAKIESEVSAALAIKPEVEVAAIKMDIVAQKSEELLMQCVPGSFQHTLVRSKAKLILKDILKNTPGLKAAILEAKNDPDGFGTDENRPGQLPYPEDTVLKCFIEAKMRGLDPFNQEWMILNGGMYPKVNGVRKNCHSFPGLSDLDIRIGVMTISEVKNSRGKEDRSATMPCSATWKIDGAEMSISPRDITVPLPYPGGIDSAKSKAERRIMVEIMQRSAIKKGLKPMDFGPHDVDEKGEIIDVVASEIKSGMADSENDEDAPSREEDNPKACDETMKNVLSEVEDNSEDEDYDSEVMVLDKADTTEQEELNKKKEEEKKAKEEAKEKAKAEKAEAKKQKRGRPKKSNKTTTVESVPEDDPIPPPEEDESQDNNFEESLQEDTLQEENLQEIDGDVVDVDTGEVIEEDSGVSRESDTQKLDPVDLPPDPGKIKIGEESLLALKKYSDIAIDHKKSGFSAPAAQDTLNAIIGKVIKFMEGIEMGGHAERACKLMKFKSLSDVKANKKIIPPIAFELIKALVAEIQNNCEVVEVEK